MELHLSLVVNRRSGRHARRIDVVVGELDGETPDHHQRRQLQLFARDVAAVLARVVPIYEILRTASAVEADMDAVYREMSDHRLQQIRKVAGWLAARGPLRVDVDRAAEIIWALASPDIALALCNSRGWTLDEFAGWLEDTLARTLLDPEPTA